MTLIYLVIAFILKYFFEFETINLLTIWIFILALENLALRENIKSLDNALFDLQNNVK